ncbi:Rid family hydrolase [Prolixibacteraceae bacterium]|nr:Rid family hydrolase [Prolixibacteraceae bacterium]
MKRESNMLPVMWNKTSDKCQMSISTFTKERTSEHHIMITPRGIHNFYEQYQTLKEALLSFILERGKRSCHLIFQRIFFSDITNQSDIITDVDMLKDNGIESTISCVQQAPLNHVKCTLYAYLIETEEQCDIDHSNAPYHTEIHKGNYSHLWSGRLVAKNNGSSYQQTENIFGDYHHFLTSKGYHFEEMCHRTWLYVRDVDTNYHGVVEARNDYFDTVGLVPSNHFVTSTGIEGRDRDVKKNVLMDAYAVKGLKKEQVRYIKALTHLNPTHEYGVRFERGTAIEFGDRKHIYISGTASIDNKGEIVHSNHILLQADRAMENISALLDEEDATTENIMQMIIYLRDVADYSIIETYYNERYPNTPKVIVLAPVCRPGWLIEIECIAIKSIHNPDFANF